MDELPIEPTAVISSTFLCTLQNSPILLVTIMPKISPVALWQKMCAPQKDSSTRISSGVMAGLAALDPDFPNVAAGMYFSLLLSYFSMSHDFESKYWDWSMTRKVQHRIFMASLKNVKDYFQSQQPTC